MSTAYVFNGFKDLILQYAGLPNYFPYNETTRMGDKIFTSPDERNRNHESNPQEGAIFETKRDAIEFCTDLMNRHYQGYQTEGVVYVGAVAPTKEQQTKCIELGRIKKMRMVEQAVADHRVAQNAGKHHDIDSEIVGWMREYGIVDNIYNQSEGDGKLSETRMAELGVLAAAIVDRMQANQKESAGKK